MSSAPSPVNTPSPSAMRGDRKPSGRNILFLALVGVLCLPAAFLYRQHWLAARAVSPQPPQVPVPQQAQALTDQLRALRLAVQQSPNDTARRWKLVEFYEQVGLLEQAGPQLEALVRLDPDSERAHVELADMLLAVGRGPQAEAAYNAAVRRWPDSANGWQGVATARYHAGNYLESMEAAQRACKLKPDDPNNKLILATASLEYCAQFSDAGMHNDRLALARGLLADLAKTWPDRGEIFSLMGRASYVARDYPEAVTNLERATRMLPDNAGIVVYLIRAYNKVGNHEAARRTLEDALARKLSSADLFDLYGQMQQASGEPGSDAKALKAYSQANRLAPGSVPIMEKLGAACLSAGRLDEARLLFEKSVQINPNRAFPYQQLALIYNRLGRREQATAVSRLATQMAFNDNQLKQVQSLSKLHPESVSLHLILADRYKTLRETGAAKDEYLLVLQSDAANKHARSALATLAAAQKKEQMNKREKDPMKDRPIGHELPLTPVTSDMPSPSGGKRNEAQGK